MLLLALYHPRADSQLRRRFPDASPAAAHNRLARVVAPVCFHAADNAAMDGSVVQDVAYLPLGRRPNDRLPQPVLLEAIRRKGRYSMMFQETTDTHEAPFLNCRTSWISHASRRTGSVGT